MKLIIFLLSIISLSSLAVTCDSAADISFEAGQVVAVKSAKLVDTPTVLSVEYVADHMERVDTSNFYAYKRVSSNTIVGIRKPECLFSCLGTGKRTAYDVFIAGPMSDKHEVIVDHYFFMKGGFKLSRNDVLKRVLNGDYSVKKSIRFNNCKK